MQNLWQVRYEVFQVADESIKLNAKMNTIIKNTKRVELNTNTVSAALNT